MTTAASHRINHAIISRNPAIVSGQPTFPGTRVLVRTLRDYLRGGHSIDCFLEDYTTVSREQVLAVLDLVFDPVLDDGGSQTVRRSWKDYFARASRPTQDFVDAVLNRKDLPQETRRPFD